MNKRLPFKAHAMRCAVGAAAVLITLAGCAGGYGNLSPSREVTAQFHAYEVLPDHRYYYSGPDAYPFGIIGINSDYTLESAFWKPVDLTPSQLRAWINFSRQRVGYDLNVYGAAIKGPAGEEIGVWYAVRDWRARGTVRVADGHRVHITTPDLQRNGGNSVTGKEWP